MRKSARLVLVLIGFSLMLFFVSRTVGLIGSHWDLGYPESALIYKISAISRGQALYTDWNKEPYSIAPYTPIYYLTAGGLSAVLKLELPMIYVISRGLSLAATLMCSGVIYILSRRLGVSRYVSWVGSGIFLSSPLLVPWGYTSRPDAMALFFSLMALVMIVRKGRFSFWLSALFAVLSFYTKQSYGSVTAATVIYWLINREYGRAIGQLATVTLGVLTVFLLGNFITGGELYRNVVLANIVRFDVNNIHVVLAYVLIYNFHPAVLAALSFWIYPTYSGLHGKPRRVYIQKPSASRASLLTIKIRKDDFLRLFKIYFGLSMVVAVGLSFKPGADVNYYLEPMAVGVLLAGRSLDWLIRRVEKVGLVWLLGAGYVLLAMYAVLIRHERVELETSGVVDLTGFSGPVLTQDPGLTVRMGRELVIADAFNYSFLADQKLWDPVKLAEMIDEKKYKAIVLFSDVNNLEKLGGVTTWPKSLVDPIVNNYELVYHRGRNFVYVPK